MIAIRNDYHSQYESLKHLIITFIMLEECEIAKKDKKHE